MRRKGHASELPYCRTEACNAVQPTVRSRRHLTCAASCRRHPSRVLQSLLLAAAPAPMGGLAKFVPAQLKGKDSEQVCQGACLPPPAGPLLCRS
jgi:hypothetical protein